MSSFDFTKVKKWVIPEGEVKSLSIGGKVVWQKASTSEVPDGYQLCEYLIPNLGHVDTGVRPTKPIIEMKMRTYKFNTTDCLWCSRENLTANSFTCFVVAGAQSDSQSAPSLRFDYGSEQGVKKVLTVGTDYVLKADGANFYMDGTLAGTLDGSLTVKYPITLFDSRVGTGACSQATYNACDSSYIYYCKIWDGTTLVRDFVPVMRTSDSVYGLWDKVGGKFYASAYSGSAFGGKVSDGVGEDGQL